MVDTFPFFDSSNLIGLFIFVAQDPTQAHIQWLPVTFHPVVMRPRSEADRHRDLEIINEWSYASVPHIPSWRHRENCIKQGNTNM